MKLGIAVTTLVAATLVGLTLHLARERVEVPRKEISVQASSSGEPEQAQAGLVQTESIDADSADQAGASVPSAPNPKSDSAASAEKTEVAGPQDLHEDHVAERIDQLLELAADQNPGNLETILSELTNGNSEIREAARQAAAGYGSKEAIPKLKQVLAQTRDASEKAALEETIEYLTLPSLTEVLGIKKKPGSQRNIPQVSKARR